MAEAGILAGNAIGEAGMNGGNDEQIRGAVESFLQFAAFNWRREIPGSVLKAWSEELSGFPIELVERALCCARSSVHMPNIGDVKAILQGLIERRALEAPASRPRRLLGEGSKPHDWRPLTPEERSELFAKFKTAFREASAAVQMPQPAAPVELEKRLRMLQQQANDMRRMAHPVNTPTTDPAAEEERHHQLVVAHAKPIQRDVPGGETEGLL